MRRRTLLQSLATAALWPTFARSEDAPVSELEAIRSKHGLPALGGGIVDFEGLHFSEVVGVRKAGDDTAATSDDHWHIGSMTKAMTAALVATWIEAGELKWQDTLGRVIPKDCERCASGVTDITIEQLLRHRSGLPANLPNWWALARADQREEILRHAAPSDKEITSGAGYLYSNVGYAVAGRVLEKLERKLWEDLIQERLFKPLEMKAGIGPAGTEGKVDQPWPHGEDGKPRPTNGLFSDNPPSLGPAGRVHASLADYARFAADHLKGAAGEKGMLKSSTYETLFRSDADSGYACGWIVSERPWAGGRVLTHTGSNTSNFFVAWLAPEKKFGIVACTNQGGDAAQKGCDDVCGWLIGKHLA